MKMKKIRNFFKKRRFNLISFIIVSVIPIFLSILIIPLIMENEAKTMYGWYFINIKGIGIKIENLNAYTIRHTINHEIGHHIWHTCLQDYQIKNYKIIMSNLSEECKYYNDINEDFSESYANYLLGNNFAFECSAKFKYFRNLSYEKFTCNE